LNQVSPVRGEHRLRRLEWVWGDKRTETLYREQGCVFKVDLSEVYFSPRLSFERMRIAKLVRANEEVVNMFSGVGCFSILMAKHCETRMIHSIDVNPRAVRLMWENIALNRVAERVEAILGDAEDVIQRELEGVADRVLMPLPGKAYEYLGSAVNALDSGTGFIHYYDFIHVKSSKDPLKKIIDRIKAKMTLLGVSFEVTSSRIVRSIGPNWCQIALDLKVHP
jgi:tRNA (guanine37-N1)-methyltransferase